MVPPEVVVEVAVEVAAEVPEAVVEVAAEVPEAVAAAVAALRVAGAVPLPMQGAARGRLGRLQLAPRMAHWRPSGWTGNRSES